MQSINEVRLSGQVSKIYPIKHFNDQQCMLIAEITTQDEIGTFTHRVSFLNQDAISFSKTAQLGALVSIDAKLTPRLKNSNNPTGEMFFEIRCMRYYFVASQPIQIYDTATVYPEKIEDAKKEPSAVKRFINKFTPQKSDTPPPQPVEEPKQEHKFNFDARGKYRSYKASSEY